MNTPKPARGELLQLDTATLPLPAECCAKCKFFQDFDGATLCRRFPPVVTLIAVPVQVRGVIPRADQPQPMTFANQSMFGATGARDWCGEFSLAPTNGAKS